MRLTRDVRRPNHVRCQNSRKASVAPLACLARGVESPRDLQLLEADLAVGGSQVAEVGGGADVERAVGGPVQAGVTVAFRLARDPLCQMA